MKSESDLLVALNCIT
ncbi:hypothetical protein C353_03261 [Cryptococcus neoformans AD1-83a]|nr:hypothetical protein C353_03261 [Cryptococcus neoformans var. grubii AD1-83a]